jgi:hypothetical protein
MNISHEHKLIWVSPEMSGTKTVSKLLEDYGFLSVIDKTETELMGEYPDYKVICGMRNPYERVFLVYLECELYPILVKKDHFEVLKTQFNEWVRKILTPNKLKVGVNEYISKSNYGSKYLKKWVFDDKIPDFFVKTEDLNKDLDKLGFKFDEIIENKEESQFNFNQMYEYDAAKRVYHLYKKHFYLCDYNPFSFTTKELEDYEKIDLIHDIL